MLRIGLTGGMGSGKTTVARLFEVLGIPVYYADVEAKRLMDEDSSLRKNIIENFGPEAYAEGHLNKPFLANVVFNDPAKLAVLNVIVHPPTIADAAKWLARQTTSYAIKEAALLFESQADKDLDFVIGVSSPLNLRVKRIKLRDGLSQDEIEARMKKQMDEDKKISLCDFILINDEESMLIPQVLALHKKLLHKEI
ncbi:MAG: dephospho-CoA kinase [Ferruginibacter sp.]